MDQIEKHRKDCEWQTRNGLIEYDSYCMKDQNAVDWKELDHRNQPLLVQLYKKCPICSGFAIDSKLYLHHLETTINYDWHYLSIFNIDDSNEGLILQYQTRHILHNRNSNLHYFHMKDQIFFKTHADFPNKLKASCDVGYRNEKDNCVDIDECKIMRHYCDSRLFSILPYRF